MRSMQTSLRASRVAGAFVRLTLLLLLHIGLMGERVYENARSVLGNQEPVFRKIASRNNIDGPQTGSRGLARTS